MIRRKILISALLLGTFGGYGSAIAGARHNITKHRAELEQHVAYVCAEAARHPEAAPTTDARSCGDW